MANLERALALTFIHPAHLLGLEDNVLADLLGEQRWRHMLLQFVECIRQAHFHATRLSIAEGGLGTITETGIGDISLVATIACHIVDVGITLATPRIELEGLSVLTFQDNLCLGIEVEAQSLKSTA